MFPAMTVESDSSAMLEQYMKKIPIPENSYVSEMVCSIMKKINQDTERNEGLCLKQKILVIVLN